MKFTKEYCLLALILLISFSYNFYNIKFEPGYHPDEIKKADFVGSGQQDFKHPILILQLTRGINSIFHTSNLSYLVYMGRAVSCLSGVLLVFIIYLIAQEVMSSSWALLAAAATALSPILVIHAHYFKEDTLFTALAFLSIWLLARFLKDLSWKNAIFVGLALGLTVSSHYKSAILLPLITIAPLFAIKQLRENGLRLRKYYLFLLVIFLLAGTVAVAVNWPALFNTQTFLDGLTFEANHALDGHQGIRISPLPNYFTFHFVQSILPGMTPIAGVMSLIAILLVLIFWKKTVWLDRFIVSFAIVFYFAIESSVLKPWPDFMRYVIPIIPALIYLAARVISQMQLRVNRPWLFYGLFALVFIILPAIDSTRLDYHLNKDTRALTESWLNKNHLLEQAYFEGYSTEAASKANIGSQAEAIKKLMRIKDKGYKVLVSSSFLYDRYLQGSQLNNQDPEIYDYSRKYQWLFTLPYTEIKPAFKSFAFSNPVIRIINIENISAQDIPESMLR